MTKAISPAASNSRRKFRLITREAERSLDKHFVSGPKRLNVFGLSVQVALSLGLPLDEVLDIVQAYVRSRTDLRVVKGRAGGIFAT
jgi:hypothetical protein